MAGPDKVARFMAGVAPKRGEVEIVRVNGRTAAAYLVDGRLRSVLSFTGDGEPITRIDIVLAPDKLGRGCPGLSPERGLTTPL